MHVKYICNWIAGYYIFNFDCATISNLWDRDNYIPMEDTNLVEIKRGAVLWCIWLDRNRFISKEEYIKNLQVIG